MAILFWARKHAIQSSWGANLGLGASALLEWKAQRGMSWSEFWYTALGAARGGPPDILLIHLGGNDLAKIKGKELILCYLGGHREMEGEIPTLPSGMVHYHTTLRLESRL